jgi:hypothetical protein
MAEQQLSETEIQTMRRMLAEHDSKQKPVTIHDLNAPPREPYRFQKFPMMVYDLERSNAAFEEEQRMPNGGFQMVHVAARVVSRLVQSEHELKQALADGWSESAPEYREERDEPLNARYAGEAARVDAQIEETKRKAGRPTKAEQAARSAQTV